MPENEKPVNTHWLIGIAGIADPLLVWAAYISHAEDWQKAEGAGAVTGPVILKDASHKIVFRGSEREVQYVRRVQPGMARNLETGGYKPPADEPEPYSPVHVTMGPLTTAGAAPVPQTMYLNFPAAGQKIG